MATLKKNTLGTQPFRLNFYATTADGYPMPACFMETAMQCL